GVVRFVGRCRMPTPHDPAGAAALVGATLDTARRRIIVRDVLRALASGAIAAAVVLALSLAASVSIAIRAAAALSAFAATGAAVIILTRKARTRAAAPVAIAGVAAMGHARADRAASTGGAPVTAEREDAPGDVLIDVVPPAYTGR